MITIIYIHTYTIWITSHSYENHFFCRKWLPNQIRKISQGKISLEKSATGQDGRAAVLQKKLSKKEFKVRQDKSYY